VNASPATAPDVRPMIAALRTKLDALAFTPGSLTQQRAGLVVERAAYLARSPSGGLLMSTYFDGRSELQIEAAAEFVVGALAVVHIPAQGRRGIIGVVAVDAALSKAECRRLAVSAQDGLVRAVRPAHTLLDGDTIFALATGARALPTAEGRAGDTARALALDALCSASARVFERAVAAGHEGATGSEGHIS